MSDSEEENNTLNVEKEREAAKKAADEEAAKKAADEEAAKKAADEAAEAKRIADEEAAKKAADEEAAKKATDEAAEAKRIADEEAAKKAADEEAAKKAADEEAAELAEQLLEVTKLNAITNNLWKDGQKTNFESMSHTETGVLRSEFKKRAGIHQGFMTSLTRNSNKILRQNVPPVKQKPVAKLSARQTLFNSGMMFGNRR